MGSKDTPNICVRVMDQPKDVPNITLCEGFENEEYEDF